MELLHQKWLSLQEKVRDIEWKGMVENTRTALLSFTEWIKSIGFAPGLEEYEKRKLGIFNQLNFLQFVAGILVPALGLFPNHKIPVLACFVACLPALLSALVFGLNAYRKYEAALISYFILHPFLICVIYLNGLNLGIDLYLILYGVLAVFFLRDIGLMLFTISFSMISYFVLAVAWKQYQYQFAVVNLSVYLFNQGLAILFIFYGLFLIKRENTGYQVHILSKNEDLLDKNREIEGQRRALTESAILMKQQTEELTELNSLKNKLFSVISHDLKSPMYALRNLFRNVQQHDLPAEEIKKLVPDVTNDLNYTISLMENLLQWAKTQMETHQVKKDCLNIAELIQETIQLLHLQAAAKQISIEHNEHARINVVADCDMLSLVMRNLLSNAIKFTPQGGHISIGLVAHASFVEVCVQDTGVGISREDLQKINANNYYTTHGTNSESGTGLGLMLCKEFLAKNGGRMYIESEQGKGSTFSFTLPRWAN